MAQLSAFSQRINQLFFGVDVSAQSNFLIDSLRSVPQLHYKDEYVRQSDLMTIIDMKSDKAWTSYQNFTFTESPFPDFKIKEGTITVTLGGMDMSADTIGKVLKLEGILHFTKKVEARGYFEKFKQFLSEVAPYKKFEHEKNGGDIAYFFNSNPAGKKVQYIILFFDELQKKKEYSVFYSFGNELID